MAMEATGIYSMPVNHALIEYGDFTQVLVCNAGHVKNVPGRKTDLFSELSNDQGIPACGRCPEACRMAATTSWTLRWSMPVRACFGGEDAAGAGAQRGVQRAVGCGHLVVPVAGTAAGVVTVRPAASAKPGRPRFTVALRRALIWSIWVSLCRAPVRLTFSPRPRRATGPLRLRRCGRSGWRRSR